MEQLSFFYLEAAQVTEKERMRMLLRGSFVVAVHISALSTWLGLLINPDTKSQMTTLAPLFSTILLWWRYLFSLRPLIPADDSRKANYSCGRYYTATMRRSAVGVLR
jgi:hypothetical protein